MRRPRTIAIGRMAIVFLIALYALAQLATNRRDDVTAVATPPPEFKATPVELKPGQELCEDDVALDTTAQVIRVYSGSPTPDVPRLRVTVKGDGYRAEALSPETGQAGGGADGIYDTRIPRPARSTMTTVCVRSASDDQAAILAGSEEERIHSRSQATVDGRPIEPGVALVVLAGGPRSPLSQAQTVFERAATFQPAPVGWVLLGLMLVVIGLGVPALAVYAVLKALREG
jgi:hypothetical protein